MGNSASKNNTSAVTCPRASLLGLPAELRLMIYDTIKDFDIQYRLPHEFGSNHLPRSRPRLPLRDLARSCKLLAREIRDHRQSLLPSERHATVRIIVRSDNSNHAYYLSHAYCPVKDLTILRLDYTVLVSSHYCWIDDFPEFPDFRTRLLVPSIPDGLPHQLDLQVFLHFRQDESSPPDEKKYLEEVKNTCNLVERSYQARYMWPKVQRLMGFTVEPWKQLPPGRMSI